MAWLISKKGNYFYAIQNVSPFIVHEYPSSTVRVAKLKTDSTTFYFTQRGIAIDGMKNLPMSEIIAENGTDFTDLATFEIWKNINTGADSQEDATVISELQDINTNTEGSQRVLDIVSATTNGLTDAGVQSVSLVLRGNNGSINGVSLPNNTNVSFTPNKGADTVGSISYIAPTTGEGRIIIIYVR